MRNDDGGVGVHTLAAVSATPIVLVRQGWQRPDGYEPRDSARGTAVVGNARQRVEGLRANSGGFPSKAMIS